MLTTLNNSAFSPEFAATQLPEFGSELVANSQIKSCCEFPNQKLGIPVCQHHILGFSQIKMSLYIRKDIKIHAGPTEAKNFKSQLEKQKTSIKENNPPNWKKRKSPKSNESNSKPEEGEP